MTDAGRRTGATTAAVAFLLWHGTAIVVGPLPAGTPGTALRPVFEGYLRLGYLDHQWTFFGPTPDAGRVVQFEVLLPDDGVREVALSDAVSRTSPSWFRWMRLFDRVANGQTELQQSAASFLCQHQGELRPVAVRFVVLHRLTPSPALYLAGVRSGDPEAFWREPGMDMACETARVLERDR